MVSEVLPAGALIGAEGYESNASTNHAMLATAGKTRDFEDYVDKCNKVERLVTAIRNNNMKDFRDLMYELNGRMIQEDKDRLLAIACQYSREDIARLLLAVGADVRAVERICRLEPGNPNRGSVDFKVLAGARTGGPALIRACERGDEAEVKFLLSIGADVNHVPPDGLTSYAYGGWTPLTFACSRGKEAMVKLLLEKGADVNHVPPNGGWTALMIATSRGNEAMVKLLLEKGADVNRETKDGRLALSIGWKDPSMRSLLLKAGASKDLALLGMIRYIGSSYSPSYGREYYSRNHQTILELVRSGANVNIVGKDGKTPLMLAREKKLKEVEQLLIAAGATR